MAFQNSDLLAINRGGVNYQVTWGDIVSRQVLATDLLMLQRGGTIYHVPIGNFWDCTSISDELDFYLAERNLTLYAQTYKFPCSIQFSLSDNGQGISTTLQLSASPVNGDPGFITYPDGTQIFLSASSQTITLTQPGVYTVGESFTEFKFTQSDSTIDASLTPASVWNDHMSGIADFGAGLFTNVRNLSGVPSGLQLRSLDKTFEGTSPTTDIGVIDTSVVTSAVGTFLNSDVDSTDNIDIWDTSNVTNMSRMFEGAANYNGDISTWDVSNVTDMSAMFKSASNFNQDLELWGAFVDNVTNMNAMFSGASQFNGAITTWDTSNVEDMNSIFDGSSSFNQDIGDWDVGSAVSMTSAFRNTNQFNQDLTEWCVNLIPSEPNFFDDGSALQVANQPVWGTCPGLVYNGEFYFTGGSTQMTLSGTLGSAGTVTQPDGTTFSIGPGNWNRTITQQGTYQLPMETMTALSFDNSNNRQAEFSFAPDFYTGALTTTYKMFHDCYRFVGTNVGNWDVSNVTNMSQMFAACFLFNDPVDNWDVSNVTNMAEMFSGAFVFNQPVNSWNVTKVTNMNGLFSNCLEWDQDLDQWNMSRVEDISEMLYRCLLLVDPNIGGWDTSNVTNMASMFGSSVLATPDLSAWDTSSVKKNGFGGMFDNARAFNSDISNWSVNNESDVSFSTMFEDAHSFNQDLSSWDMSRTGDTGEMFQNAYAFNQDISGWVFSPIWDRANNMFAGASAFNQDISSWCAASFTSEPTSFDDGSAFDGETALQPNWSECSFPGSGKFTITDFQTSPSLGLTIKWHNGGTRDITGPSGPISVTSGTRVSLTELGTYDIPMGSVEGISFAGAWQERFVVFDFAPDFYTGSVTNMQSIFMICMAFNGDISNWDTSSVTTFRAAFNEAQSFNGDISAWDTSSVTDMTQMFRNSYVFNSAMGDWDTSSVGGGNTSKGFYGMFDGASSFDQPLQNWDVSNTTNMRFMFASATSFNQWLNSWDVSNITEMGEMFKSAAAMNSDISNWCVSQIAGSPSNFSTGASFDGDLSLLPSWGECSAFNGIYLEDLVGGTGDLVIAGTGKAGESGNIRQPDGTLTAWSAGNFANKFTQLGWYEIQNMEGLDGLRFFDNDVFVDDTSETALFRLSPTLDSSNLTETRQMFREALLFNGDVSMLNVSNATNMAGMFRNAATFDQDVSHFVTYNATNMSNMFRGATRFNRDLSEWNTATVSGMTDMFNNADAFNQNLSGWCVPLIGSEPSSFDTNSGFDGQTARQPGWGGCPSDFTIDTDVVIGTATGADPVLYGTVITITAAATTTPTGVSVISSQWQKSTDGGANWADIGGETGSTYTVTVTDRDDQIRLIQVLENGTTSPLRTSTSNVLTVEDNP